MESVAQALENLANAAIANRDSTAILISANKELTESNKLLAEQVKKLNDEMILLHLSGRHAGGGLNMTHMDIVGVVDSV
eukprot:1853795-Ditylum_brightwellii.AAC.1